MDRRPEIREFLRRLLLEKGDQRPFRDNESLVLSGRLQSVDAVEVVLFLEDKWNIDFAEIGFDEGLIDNVDAICTLIQKTELAR
jgi:acyl carrier protein